MSQRYHAAVSAIGYDDKSGLLVIAGDSGSISSSPSSQGSSSTGSSSGANSPVAPSAAFAEEGVTVSVWQLQVRQLNLRFALGKPQVRGYLLLLGAVRLCACETFELAATGQHSESDSDSISVSV